MQRGDAKRGEWIRTCEAEGYEIVRDLDKMKEGNIILVVDELFPHVSAYIKHQLQQIQFIRVVVNQLTFSLLFFLTVLLCGAVGDRARARRFLPGR